MENKFYLMLTSAISHELRTPLNSLLNLFDTLKPFIGDNNDGLVLLKVMKNSA